MSLEGNLSTDDLGEVLASIDSHRRTGILTIQGSREIVAISFLNGEVMSADALNQSLEDGLGSVLADLDLVSPDDFAGLAAEHQAGGGRVVELVVERAFVSRRGLLAALRIHTYRLCVQALAWSEGEFKFYQGKEVSFEQGITPIPVAELLSRAATDLGWPSLTRGRFPGFGSVFGRRADATFDQGVDWEQESAELGIADLAEEAREVFSRLDGAASVGEIVESTGIPDFRVTYLISRWWAGDLVDELDSRPHETSVAESVDAVELSEPEIERLDQPIRRMDLRAVLARLFRARSPAFGETVPWIGRVPGLLMLAVLAVLAVRGPGELLEGGALWTSSGSHAVRPAAEDPTFAVVHRAANTFFLLYGRYPEDVELLVELDLMDPRDLAQEEDARLRLAPTAVSYVVSRVGSDAVVEATATGTIVGNFLLDPDFGHGVKSEIPPLVLLD